jgi:cytochrome c oxidase subunit 1
MALSSAWVYTIGVLIFARGMISAGLEGMPRRTFRVAATYTNPAWDFGGALTGIGGTLMFFGIAMFFIVIAMTAFAGVRGTAPRDVPVSETLTAPAATGWERYLDRLGIWVVATILLCAIAYGPFLAMYLPARLVSPGFRLF